MHRSILLIIALSVLIVPMVYGQATSATVEQTAQTGFQRGGALNLGVEETITAEAMIPQSSVYQIKTDTPVKPVYYRFNRNVVRETNKILLNKWLKESK